jgi:hypothetical protein
VTTRGNGPAHEPITEWEYAGRTMARSTRQMSLGEGALSIFDAMEPPASQHRPVADDLKAAYEFAIFKNAASTRAAANGARSCR